MRKLFFVSTLFITTSGLANAQTTYTAPTSIDISNAHAGGDTVSQIDKMAAGSVQKSTVGAASGVAPLDANKMMPSPVSGDTSASPATAVGATNPRAISNHLADFVNVRDYGAKLDGSTDDSAAFAHAKANATDGQNIVVPPGTTTTVNLSAIPQGEAGKTNIWWLFGRTLPGGSPLFTFGSDTVFSSINGGLWLHRDDNITGQGPALRTDVTFKHDGDNGAATQANCNANAVSFSGASGLWCNQTIMHTSATNGAQIAESASAFREGIGGQMWGRYTEASDKTGLSSDKSGSVAGHEEDVYANDKDPYNWRIIQENMIARFLDNGYAARVGTGNLWGRNDSVSYYGTVIRIEAPWDTAGVDLSKGGPLAILGTITQAADAGATILTLDTTHNGVEVGQSVSGNGVASGTTVTSITDTTVTLSAKLTAAVKVGDTLRFASDAPAIRLGNDQYISYLGDNSVRMYGDADSHSLSTQIDGVVRFAYGAHGDTSVYGDGTGNVLTAHGNFVTGLDFTESGFLGSTILLNTNQYIAWELSQTVKTSFSNGALTDQVASGIARTLDTDGNEIIPGTHTAKGGYVLPNMTTAQIKAIVNPPNALEVYDTDTKTPVILVDGIWRQINIGDAL